MQLTVKNEQFIDTKRTGIEIGVLSEQLAQFFGATPTVLRPPRRACSSGSRSVSTEIAIDPTTSAPVIHAKVPALRAGTRFGMRAGKRRRKTRS